MNTVPDKRQPSKGKCIPKKPVRPKERSSIPTSSSSKSKREIRKKGSAKKDACVRKQISAQLFAPTASCSSTNKDEKPDISFLDPVNIDAFIKKMEKKEKALEKMKALDPIDDFSHASTSSQAGGSGPSTSSARAEVRRLLNPLEEQKKALEELIHDYDSFLGNAACYAPVFRNRGDVFTASVLESIKVKNSESSGKRQVKKKH